MHLFVRRVPLLGAVTIRFFRPLRPWQRHVLVTRIAGWDEKWFYLERRFESEGMVVAREMVKPLLRGLGGPHSRPQAPGCWRRSG